MPDLCPSLDCDLSFPTTHSSRDSRHRSIPGWYFVLLDDVPSPAADAPRAIGKLSHTRADRAYRRSSRTRPRIPRMSGSAENAAPGHCRSGSSSDLKRHDPRSRRTPLPDRTGHDRTPDRTNNRGPPRRQRAGDRGAMRRGPEGVSSSRTLEYRACHVSSICDRRGGEERARRSRRAASWAVGSWSSTRSSPSRDRAHRSIRSAHRRGARSGSAHFRCAKAIGENRV